MSAAPVRDLIYDVGMHCGEDTAYYLALGYRVIAFEANPELTERCRREFKGAVDAGALTIVDGAIAGPVDEPVTFYLDEVSQWGSIDPDWVRKKQISRSQQSIAVPSVDFAACLRRYGVPYYLKIDIEGADRLCLAALCEAPGIPRFVSLEADPFDLGALGAELDLLEELGYTRFAAVRQDFGGREIATRSLSGKTLTHRFPSGASGPFGEDLPDRWLSRREVEGRHRRALRWRSRLIEPGSALHGAPAWGRHPGLWRRFGGYYDTHARR